MGDITEAVGVVVLGDTLAVASTDASFPIALYQDAANIADGALRDAGIAASEVSAFSTLGRPKMFAGSDGTLWLSRSDNDVFRSYPNASTLGNATVAGPIVSHAYQQLIGFAITAGNERVFAGQISGGGVVMYNDPLAGSGTLTPDLDLDTDCNSWAMTLHADDLYVTCQGRAGGDAQLRIWRNAASISSVRAADVAVTLPSTDAWGIAVLNDMLAITTSSDGVLIYTGPSSLAPSSVPINTLDAGFFPRKVLFDQTGRLYTRASDPTGIQIFANVTTVSTRHTLITQVATDPADFAIIE